MCVSRVSDTGPGVAGHQLEDVFEPFVTSKPQGLGLGLAVCRSIVTAHEGTLWAENNPDGGASFCFELPCLEIESLAPTAVPSPAPSTPHTS